MTDILETDYIHKWAHAIAELEVLPALRLPDNDLHAKVAALLGPLGPTQSEITAIVLHIRDLIRRQAPPADSPRARGAERMYR